MKTHKKASPGNGKNNKVKNNRKQSGHSGRFAKSLLLTEGLLIVLAVMVLMGIRLWQKSNPASAASAVLQDKPDGLNLVHASDPSARSAKAAQKNSKDSSGDTPKGLQPEAFAPHCTESTAPSNYIQTTEINIDGTTLTDPLSYKPDQEISFGKGSEYTDVDGIVTFRGNNFRDNPVYGTADMKKNKLTSLWSSKTSSITYNGATWSGSGWTGQPLMMKWPKKVKKAMNMYDWAKEKDDLVEVIYACMDGYVYFLDLETGEATRDTLNLGFTFKGSGALDPRGYPILYVGAGYDSNQGTARVFVVNLLDCSVMYTFGNNDPFSLRGALSYFDSSPLVDAVTDTLIYPGENGILYLIRLNTQYDQEAGTLSINPDHIVKWHYYGNRTSVASYWLGMEDSAAVYGGYLFVTDNGGNLMCLNLNTLQLVWAQDTLDDSNSTPVLSIEDDHLYLYVSTSFRLGWRSSSSAEVPIWKIDAQNGRIIWKTSYECYSDDGVSGGVQSTIALGKKKLSDYIYVTVAKTGAQYDGVLACLDKKTGEVKWEHKAYYAWSSPVCVYNSDGSGKVLYCSCGGKAYLLDGNSGKLLDENEISSGAIEASPAIYNDYMVVGTRDCRICGLKLE
ncbi:MAG: PQQ-binding-like beta-propeller repeat protein [Blautia sp.]